MWLRYGVLDIDSEIFYDWLGFMLSFMLFPASGEVIGIIVC